MTYIEVITFDKRGNRLDCAETDSCDAALVAARTLWDDRTGEQIQVGSVGFYTPQEEDGEPKLVRLCDRRP